MSAFHLIRVLVAGQVLSVQAGPVLARIDTRILMDKNVYAFSLCQLLARMAQNKAELYCSESQKAHNVTNRTGRTTFSVRCHVSTQQMFEQRQSELSLPSRKDLFIKDKYTEFLRGSSHGWVLPWKQQTCMGGGRGVHFLTSKWLNTDSDLHVIVR